MGSARRLFWQNFSMISNSTIAMWQRKKRHSATPIVFSRHFYHLYFSSSCFEQRSVRIYILQRNTADMFDLILHCLHQQLIGEAK
ncbi:hypothetical protein KIN20_012590 [Parelaphostrongylus tenuis]|uniref:Uncharacterized protein n=1 Tax=Parelaphostrongylus tenuis TaxID=148309 RepID=A0AAD5QKE2_PARTN|nr:hypothetical protein KIN20_012590 [Parelaphostrongylus tenuis]